MDPKEVVDNIKTNEDMLHYIMNFSSHGAMAQIFVIEALRYYSEKVTEKGEPNEEQRSIISPIAWYQTGLEIQNLLKAKYERKTP
jgi:hypothetical protein